MANKPGRGWHGDPEEHAEAARNKTNWWPLLMIPLAFFIGWGVNEAGDKTTDMSSNYTTEQGIGGSGDVQCNPTGDSTE